MSEKHTCVASIYSSYHSHACGKTAKFERKGKWYCGTHDPERIAAKDLERHAKWDRQSAIRDARWDIDKARDVAADAIEAGDISSERQRILRAAIQDARAKLAELEASA